MEASDEVMHCWKEKGRNEKTQEQSRGMLESKWLSRR